MTKEIDACVEIVFYVRAHVYV